MRAFQSERRGNVAPVALPTGTLAAGPVALFPAVSRLRQVGLEADARRRAAEAAFGAEL
jgi:hypothetical protein